MIVDSSAIIAILTGEDDAETFADLINAEDDVAISAVTYVECAMVMSRFDDPVMRGLVDELIREEGIEVVAFDHAQGLIAVRAFSDFGKGSGHGAGLNFGDCMSYALAKVRRQPLLFKGDDFAQTDLMSAMDGYPAGPIGP